MSAGKRQVGAIFVLSCLLLVVLLYGLWQKGLDYYGGHWQFAPEDAPWVLSKPAQTLIAQTFADSDHKAVIDHGVQIIAPRHDASLGWPDDKAGPGDDVADPRTWLATELRRHAGGVADSSQPGAQYVSRLLRQIRAMPGPYVAWVQAQPPLVGNRQVHWLGEEASGHLRPVVSMTPDGNEQVARWAKAKLGAMQWQPAQAPIKQPATPSEKVVFKRLAQQDIRLQISVGQWQAADGRETWVDPEIADTALAAGVAVELVLGGPTGNQGQRLMPGVLALLDAYPTRAALTVSLGGVLATDRVDAELRPLLQHPQFYDQLVYASGYPDSAAPGAVDLDRLIAQGFLEADQRAPLQDIYQVNPLLFVLATMRALHLPQTDLSLPASVFFAR